MSADRPAADFSSSFAVTESGSRAAAAPWATEEK